MFVLTETPSIASHFVNQLRDKEVQKDRRRFRQNLERLGEMLALEISKVLSYEEVKVQTPLGESVGFQLIDNVVLLTILRAGLPFFQGFLNVFEQADSAFVGAYREGESTTGSEGVIIKADYMASPPIDDKVLIIIDPMLATGKSLVRTMESLTVHGRPKSIHVASVIASKPGISFVQQRIARTRLWTVAIDDSLNDKAYIVPGLGDAGDLAFGEKR